MLHDNNTDICFEHFEKFVAKQSRILNQPVSGDITTNFQKKMPIAAYQERRVVEFLQLILIRKRLSMIKIWDVHAPVVRNRAIILSTLVFSSKRNLTKTRLDSSRNAICALPA